MAQSDGIDGFEDALGALEATMAETGAVTSAFSAEMSKMQEAISATSVDAEALSKGLTRGLKSAFDGLVFDGMRASDALEKVARSVINTAYSSAMKPVTTGLSSALTDGLFSMFANGGSFSQGKVMPFANGGVVSGPTTFPMRGGTGLMGEAGPEAIMPLSRGPDGKLGVRSSGSGGAVQVTMNISTPDAASFQRSQSQVAAQMSRALGRGQRNR